MFELFLVKEALESTRIETGHNLTMRDVLIALVEREEYARRAARRAAKKASRAIPAAPESATEPPPT